MDRCRRAPVPTTDAEGVVALCREPGWPSFSDAQVAARACAAPGVIAWVAVESAAQDLYRSFAHREQPGFRLYHDAPRPEAWTGTFAMADSGVP